VDNNKAQKLCLETQRYYEKHNFKTQVLPASLTSTDEIMALAGVNHITIAPALLQKLATTSGPSGITSLFDQLPATFEPHPLILFGKDESAFRIAFTRSGNGEGERKLSQVRRHSEAKFF